MESVDNEASQRSDWLADILMLIWYGLLIPWLFVAFLSGMVFDAGRNIGLYIMVWAIWLYPVSVVVAAKLRDGSTWLVLLPFFNGALLVFGAALGNYLPKH